jgi:predicted DNA-binding protein
MTRKTDTTQLRVRMRRDLLKRLEAAAKQHERPLNTEIVDLLERGLKDENMLIRVVEVIREIDSKKAGAR